LGGHRRQANRRSGAQVSPRRDGRLPDGLILSAAGLGLVFASHMAYGAIRIEPALVATALAALLLAVCIAIPSLRRDLLRIRGLAWPAILFALTLVVGLLSLTPFAPGGPHPVWAYVSAGPGSGTVDPSATILELIKLGGLACLFVVGVTTGASDERARTAVNLLIGLSVLFGLWAFFAFTTGTIFQTQRGRLEGTLMSPNTAGTFFAALLVVTLGPLMRNLRGVQASRALQAGSGYWIALLVLVACLLMTASRGAALGAAAGAVGLVIMLFFAGQASWNRASMLLLAAVFGAAAGLYAFGGNLVERFADINDGATGRADLFAMHWRAFQAAPLGGYGLGTFETIHRTLLDAQSLESVWRIRATHNVYIQWLEEAGLAGALPMFGCIALIIGITLFRGMRRSRMTHVLFALVAADLVFLIHGFTDFALQTPSMAMMWSYLLGLQFALSQGSRR